jgi:hypothetical protein
MLALYHLFIYVLPLEIQLSRGEGWDPIHKSITFLCLSQARINISVISWQSVLLVEESGVPGENHQPATSH